MSEKRPVLRELDDEARALARTLLRGARSGALAVIEPDTEGFPLASRVLLGMDIDGSPVILVSHLSAHTRALLGDARCSLLVGETGKGDPLAHPRLTVQCRAVPVHPDTADHARLRARFLRRHPKSETYMDFPDFLFFRLVAERANLNGGFARAYRLGGEDLAIRSPASAAFAEIEADLIEDMMTTRPQAAAHYAVVHCKAPAADWQVVGIDMAGLDLAAGDLLQRMEFGETMADQADIRAMLLKLYQ